MPDKTVTTGGRQGGTLRCLICQNSETKSPYDACDGCKARMFDEYLAVKGGF